MNGRVDAIKRPAAMGRRTAEPNVVSRTMRRFLSRGLVSRGLVSRGLVVALLGLAVAGCDKCGNPVHINTPSIPHACTTDDAQG